VTTGNALADMYLGRIQQYSEATEVVNGNPIGGNPKGHWRVTEFEPYFQDDWKLNSKLTINLGARYYFYVPYHDISKPQTLDSNFVPSLYDPSVAALLDSSGNIVKDPSTGHIYDYTGFGNGLYACGSKEVPKGCTHINRGTIAPRFGFAYDPFGTGKTVIRGGYGMYFEAFNQNETSALTNPPPPPWSPTPSTWLDTTNSPRDRMALPASPSSRFTSTCPAFSSSAWGSSMNSPGTIC
jgi:hypothetical protein